MITHGALGVFKRMVLLLYHAWNVQLSVSLFTE